MSETSIETPAKTIAPPPPSEKRRRSRFWRWVMRLLVAAVTLLIVMIVAVHIVLGTDIPRKMIVVQLQRSLGLRVAAEGASVSWMGGTTLRSVKLSLPLADQAIIDMPEMSVRHTILPLLLLGKSLDIKSVSLKQPTLTLVQDASGRWNVMRAIDIASRRSVPATPSPRQAAVNLPSIDISDGTIVVIDNRDRTTTIAPLALSGKPDGALVWHYQGGVEKRFALSGDIAPGAAWEHSLDFRVEDIKTWLAPWLQNPPQIAAAGTWRGKVSGPVVNGRLQLKELGVGSYSASGDVLVDRDESGISLQPADLLVNLPEKLLPQARMSSGQFLISGAQLRARSIALAGAGGRAQLEGEWDRAAGSANLRMDWSGLTVPVGTSHQGTITATLETPLPGGQKITANIFSGGQSLDGAWEARFDIAGAAHAAERIFGHANATQPFESWPQHFDWQVKAPTIAWRGPQAFDLHDVLAKLTSRGAAISLDDVSITGKGKLAGRGQFDPTEKKWWLWLAGRDFPMTKPKDTVFGFNLVAFGADQFAELRELLIHLNTMNIWLGGTYDARVPKPVAANLHIWKDPQTPAELPQTLHGNVRVRANLIGTLWPRDLELDGHLLSSDLVINDTRIGDADIAITGRVEPKYIWLETKEDATLLGGKSHARAEGPLNGDRYKLVVRSADVPLSEISALVKGPKTGGKLDGALTVETSDFDLERLNLSGIFEARDISLGKFAAEHAKLQLTMRDGQVSANPIDLEQGAGRAHGRIEFALKHRKDWRVLLNATEWPIVFSEGAVATVTADADGQIDVSSSSAKGAAHGLARFRIDDQDAGQATLNASADGRIVRVSELNASAFNGTATASGIFPLDKPVASVARIELSDIDASQLAKFLPKQADGLAGKISGSATLAASDNPRAVAPMRVEVKLNPQEARYRTLPIGQANLEAFVEPGNSLVDVRRFILNNSLFHLGNGTVRGWLRYSRHPERAAAGRSSQMQVDFDSLDLDQVVHAVAPQAHRTPGQLAGSIILVGDPRLVADPKRQKSFYGQGNIKITHSDLAATNLIGGLYELMHAERDVGADGNGEVELSLEGDVLRINSFRYFNKGTDIRANGVVRDFFQIPNSRIEAYGFGSLRPLRDIRIPFMAQADQIFTALQQNAVADRISGTLAHPIHERIAFGEIGEGLQRIILGDVKGETK